MSLFRISLGSNNELKANTPDEIIQITNLVGDVDIKETTPVEKVGNIFLKRDDKFEIHGVCGGKSRSAYQLILDGLNRGYNEFVTAGSRMSPQCEIVSYLCQSLGVKCHLFMPTGKDTSVIENIGNNDLSELHRIKVGYNSVIIKRAKDFAGENKFYYIPFGMECEENIEVTKHQVCNIPDNIKRIVMPVGSGMSFISVMNGLEHYKMYGIEVLGVSVGTDVTKNLQKYLRAPNIKYNIVKSELNYDDAVENNFIGDVELDKIYEAKCLPYLKDNDLLWIVGKRL